MGKRKRKRKRKKTTQWVFEDGAGVLLDEIDVHVGHHIV